MVVVAWLAWTAVCWWLLFRGGAESIANGWLTHLVFVPGMDEREVKFGIVIGWLASTIGLGVMLFV